MTPYQTTFTAAIFDPDLPPTTETLSLWRRLELSILSPLLGIVDMHLLMGELETLRRKHGVPPDLPSFDESQDVLQLINTFFGFEAGIRVFVLMGKVLKQTQSKPSFHPPPPMLNTLQPAVPLPPNVHVVGPILSDTYPDLPLDLSTFLSTKRFVVYVAFGGGAALSGPIVQLILDGLLGLLDDGIIDGVVWGYGMTDPQNFPMEVVIRGRRVTREEMMEKEKGEGRQDYVRLMKWVPQFAVLATECVKVFVSHGGAQSSHEALFNGKRLLVMPVTADQPRNAHKLVRAGVALRLSHHNLTSSEVREKVTALVQDPTGGFAEGARRLRELAQVGSRRKRYAADLIEEVVYASRVGEEKKLEWLETADRRMPWWKANNVDLWSLVVVVVVIVDFNTHFIFYDHCAVHISHLPSSTNPEAPAVAGSRRPPRRSAATQRPNDQPLLPHTLRQRHGVSGRNRPTPPLRRVRDVCRSCSVRGRGGDGVIGTAGGGGGEGGRDKAA
ncbi:hypothetical protein BC936DRAFT_145300 [Jimgerdemannia flammicorona]|uniref:Uncharacterized protein n=1 Tax=Jimgerdemannia flammicorona TaxID=994334 RepID=A0A433DAI6_9FUNG|nr:hypothetical protein BC936DRAFT_145300 [Jimgerdemannia flammicorona]